MKNKPLVERVEWTTRTFHDGLVEWWDCAVGQWTVRLHRCDREFHVVATWQPKVLEFEFSSGDLDGADVLAAAKVEALRLVQQAVLWSAEAWSD